VDHCCEKAVRYANVGELVSKAMAFLASWNVILFFGVVLIMGLCEGVMMSYTYLRVIILPHGTPIIMGLSTVCMIVSEIPFFYFSGAITRRFGLMKILRFALVCIFLRQAWNALLVDAWLLLPGELLHGITSMWQLHAGKTLTGARSVGPVRPVLQLAIPRIRACLPICLYVLKRV